MVDGRGDGKGVGRNPVVELTAVQGWDREVLVSGTRGVWAGGLGRGPGVKMEEAWRGHRAKGSVVALTVVLSKSRRALDIKPASSG